MGEDRLDTRIAPTDLATAARRHGRHFARYAHARPYARGRRVLDAACGTGFGSAYLARAAEAVLGLDLDERVIAFAREHFAADNCRFAVHDLHEPIRGEDPFGLVTSFETLEHVTDPDRCVRHLAGALAGDGVALISVPNGTKERLGGGKHYHPNQFSAGQFHDLLGGHFGRVEPFSQVYRKDLAHYLRRLTGRRGRPAENYRFEPGFDEHAKTFLAVATQPRR